MTTTDRDEESDDDHDTRAPSAVGAGATWSPPARVVRRRVRLRHLRPHQHRAAGRVRPQRHRVRHRPARAGRRARRRRLRPGDRQARRAAGARRPGHDERASPASRPPRSTRCRWSPSPATSRPTTHGRHPHQEVNLHADADQTAIYRPFVKRAWHVHRVEDLPRFPERAFWTATSGPARRRPAQRADGPVLPAAAGRGRRRYPLPAPSAAPGARRRRRRRGSPSALVGAERPLIYVGGGLRGRRRAGRRCCDLAEHLDIPIAHSLMAKGTVPDDHPLLLGMPGLLGPRVHQRVRAGRRRRAGARHPVRRDRRQLLGPATTPGSSRRAG